MRTFILDSLALELLLELWDWLNANNIHRINAAAAVRRYDVNPRLDYRTVNAVNG